MKDRGKLNLAGLFLALVCVSGCTLSTAGLRAPRDHGLAYESITEVYDAGACPDGVNN